MKYISGFLYFLTLLLENGFGKLAPDYITPCNENNYNDCVLKVTNEIIPEFVKGIPELGVPVLDPFDVKELQIPLSGLEVKFYNGKVTGFGKTVVDSLISDLKRRYFEMNFHTNLTIRGQYSAKGRLITFPIDGEGQSKIRILNLRMKLQIDTDYIKNDEEIYYITIKKYKYSFDYGDKITFYLENIFKESKELSNQVLSFLNENWRLVAEEFGKPFVDYSVELMLKSVAKFFNAVPYDELVNIPIPV